MSPIALSSMMRRIVSCTAGWYRQHRPDTIARFFSFAFVARLENAADARCIDGDRLFDKCVLALLDRIRQMLRPEMGRRGQQHHVDTAVDDLLVGVEPGEHVVRFVPLPDS